MTNKCSSAKLEKAARYRAKHRAKILAYKNSEEARARNRDLYQLNAVEIRAKKLAQYHANREHCRKVHSAWQKSDAGKESISRRDRARKAAEPQYKSVVYLRSRLCEVIRRETKRLGVKVSKPAKTTEMLGCSPSELVAYIESKFSEGMSWANRSLWHVDHIKPLSSFDLSKPAQMKKAAHYTNLQPLWAADNLSKGAKLPIDKET